MMANVTVTERAIREMAEHHAHVRLRPVGRPGALGPAVPLAESVR